ncbi:MAG: DUF3336 domain-containing protein [Parahaliea sp.]
MNYRSTLKLQRSMSLAGSYDQWHEAALAYDRSTGMDRWQKNDRSRLYDFNSIRNRLNHLKSLRRKKDNRALLFTLNEGIHGNMDGMGNEQLYFRAKTGTKALIEDYIQAVATSLEYLASPIVKDISADEKLAFFMRAHHCFGRSALMLSGSGTFLYFHIGVVRAMWSEGLVPNIVSGSSGGSVVGAIVCTHADNELSRILDEQWLIARFAVAESDKMARSHRLQDEQVRDHINQVIPDMTFQEAFELTGRHLNISIAPSERHQNSRLLNAVTSPNVLIRDAVQASCAVPGVYKPVRLMARDINGKRVPFLENRKWIDGSVADDLPAKRLARLYGVNHYIVSQANPLVARFIGTTKRGMSTFDILRDAGRDTLRTWLNTHMALMAKPLSRFPAINSAASLSMSVINQTYNGDINLVRPMRIRSLNKILGRLTAREIIDLMRAGEQIAWQRMAMIRTQTRISQSLDAILDQTDPARKEKAITA